MQADGRESEPDFKATQRLKIRDRAFESVILQAAKKETDES